MKNLAPHAKGLVAVNIAAVIFGSTALYGKLDISPIWIVAARAAFASLALATLAAARARFTRPEKKFLLPFITTGILLCVHWLTFFTSVQNAGVAIATLTFATFPMFTVFMEAARRRKMPHIIELLSSAAIIVAVLLIINVKLEGQAVILGTISGIISAIAFAWFGVSSKKFGYTISPLLVSLYQNIVVAGLLLPLLPFINAPAPADWLWLAMLGVFATALMHQLYFYALQRLSASTCSGFVALEPVYAIIFAAIFFREPITIHIVISGILIIGASIALLRSQKRYEVV